MEWDAKWGLEKLAMFGSKTCESPKKIQLADWRFVDAAELETGSFDLSGGTGIRSASSGNGVYGSSAKISVSASTDPSLKDGMNSPPPDIEPFIGLKLGKRTYFERNRGGNNVKSSLMAKIPMSSTPSAKKTKSSSQCTPTPYCQVEGCNLDLSSAKDYHRKHRVCDSHSKCPKVIVGGVERRFCQQCSRFHSLSEFDEKKRSCRRRLSDHNARRRKPLQDPTQFSLMNGRQQMNFVNQCTQFPSRTAADSTWDSTCTSKFTITRGSTSKPEKAGNTSKLQYMAGIQLPNAISPSKGTIAEVFNQGAEQSLFNSNGGTAKEVPCALSLLSSTFWGSYQPELISFDNPLPANQSSSLEPLMHATPQVLFVSSPDYLQAEHHSTDFNGHNLGVNATSGDHLSLAQLFKVPHDTDFYFNALN